MNRKDCDGLTIGVCTEKPKEKEFFGKIEQNAVSCHSYNGMKYVNSLHKNYSKRWAENDEILLKVDSNAGTVYMSLNGED